LGWLFGRGIGGAISTDLIEKYLAIKSRHPDEREDQILGRVWNLWLAVNEKHTISKHNLDKAVR
jgi:hypothetical protein